MHERSNNCPLSCAAIGGLIHTCVGTHHSLGQSSALLHTPRLDAQDRSCHACLPCGCAATLVQKLIAHCGRTLSNYKRPGDRANGQHDHYTRYTGDNCVILMRVKLQHMQHMQHQTQHHLYYGLL
jgi:hypothetical protein